MATRTNLRRTDEFDRGRDFVVVRNLTVDGRAFSPGERFDQTLVTVRRLRQMYDLHMIDITQAAPVSTLESLSNEELATRLADNNVIARPNASREWLLRKVREISGET